MSIFALLLVALKLSKFQVQDIQQKRFSLFYGAYLKNQYFIPLAFGIG